MNISVRTLTHLSLSPIHTDSNSLLSLLDGPIPKINLSTWAAPNHYLSELEGPVSQWDKAAGEVFSRQVALDIPKQRIYAALQDRLRFVSFPLSARSGDVVLEEDPQEFGFKQPLFSFATLTSSSDDARGDFVIAISEGGELGGMCLTKADRVWYKRMGQVNLDSVLAVNTLSDNWLFVAGLRGATVVIVPVAFNRGTSVQDANASPLVPIRLEKPALQKKLKTGINILQGFEFDEETASVLYIDGTLQFFKPAITPFRIKSKCFGNWVYDKHPPSEQSLVFAGARRAFSTKLKSQFRRDTPSNAMDTDAANDCYGELLNLGSQFIAVAYGSFVSVWDQVHFAGHGLVKMQGNITKACRGPTTGTVLVGGEGGLREVIIDPFDIETPATLGVVMSRKGVCDEILQSAEPSFGGVRIHSQPVTVSVMKTAAEGAGNSDRLFRNAIKSQDNAENMIIAELLNRKEAVSAKDVARMLQEYTSQGGRVRRGNRGDRSELGLSKLPSERLAATAVGRCLEEIRRGNEMFVVPLIDMIGTGVVSNECTLAIHGQSQWNFSKAKNLDELCSVVDPLLKSDVYWNALEACVTRIADLSEPDVVRVVQRIVRDTASAFKDAKETERRNGRMKKIPNKLTRVTNLLLRCVSVPGDRERFIEAFRQVPLSDVIAILLRLEHIMSSASPGELRKKSKVEIVPKELQTGFTQGSKGKDVAKGKRRRKRDDSDSGDMTLRMARTYRGLQNWMDDDIVARRKKNRGYEMQACVTWACHLIDAHLGGLVMDVAGQNIARRLHRVIQAKRKEHDMLRSLEGMTLHLMADKPTPKWDNTVGTVKIVEVPAFAALE